MSRSRDKELVRRARAQGGMLAKADAAELLNREDGLEHLVAGGLWQEVLPGVLVPAALPLTRQAYEDAVGRWDERAVLSHYSAARREGIWVPEHEDAWAMVPFKSPRRDLPGLQVRRTRKWPEWCMRLGSHRWTMPNRTLIDLSGELTRKQLEAVLMSAVRLKKTTAGALAEEAALLRTRPGVTQLLELTGLWDPKRESLLEDRMHDDVVSVVPFGVERQWVVSAGGRTIRLDVAVPELRLGFEADGLYFHSTEAQIEADQERDRWAAGQGWLTTRFREGPLDDRLLVRRQVRAIVERRRQDLGLAA